MKRLWGVYRREMAADSREDRIAQRRTRIQARIAQKLAEGSSGQVALVAQKKEVELRDISIGKAQVVETRSRLRKLVSEGDDGFIVTDTRTRKIHHLNSTASLLFELCTGSNTINEINATMTLIFPDDSWTSGIQELLNLGLVQPAP